MWREPPKVRRLLERGLSRIPRTGDRCRPTSEPRSRASPASRGFHARPGDMPADVRAPVHSLWPLGVSTHGRRPPPDVRAPALGRMVASAGRRKGRRARRGRRRGRREAGRGAEPEHKDHDSVRNRCDCTQLRREVGAQGGRGSPRVPTSTRGRRAVAPLKPPARRVESTRAVCGPARIVVAGFSATVLGRYEGSVVRESAVSPGCSSQGRQLLRRRFRRPGQR